MKNKIILGTVQFGLNYGINNTAGQIKESEIHEILDLCENSEILTLDTASAYGDSEERIGNYLQSKNKIDTFRIITKFNLKNGLSLVDSLELSLNRLKVKCIDTIMFHNFDDFKNTNSSDLKKFLQFKGDKFLNLGISLYTNEQIYEIVDLDFFKVVQIPFNALDNHNLRSEVLTKLKSKGVETHTRSVFLQGLFFMDWNKLPNKLKPLEIYLKKLDQISNDFKLNKEALALQYVAKKSYIDGVLMGVDSVKQLKSNLETMNLTIPDAAFAAIDGITVNEIELLNPAIWHQ